MVVVFANKQPDAWETLVGALIRRRIRGGRLVAHTDGDERSDALAGVGGPGLIRLAGLSEEAGGPPRLGQQRPRGDAPEYYPAPSRLLGRRHSWPGLRVGCHGAGAGGLQQAHPVVRKANAPDEIMSGLGVSG